MMGRLKIHFILVLSIPYILATCAFQKSLSTARRDPDAMDNRGGGERLAYTSLSDDGVEIYIVDNAGEHQRLSNGQGIYYLPQWSPDGMQLAYFSYNPVEETSGIWVCKAPISPDACGEIASGLKAVLGFSWSFDGNRILFSDAQEDGTEMDIYSLEIKSGTITNLTPDSPIWDSSPSTSPVEDLVAFVSDRAEGGKATDEIWIMAEDGTDLERLTFNHDFFWEDVDPEFSPDGRSIAFYRVGLIGEDYAGGIPGLWVIDLGTKSERLLYEFDGGMFSESPKWSPDGKFIAINAGDFEAMSLAIVSVFNDEVVHVEEIEGSVLAYAWSNDSEWILITKQANETFSLSLVSRNGQIHSDVDTNGDGSYGQYAPE